MSRIEKHPILNIESKNTFTIFVDGKAVEAVEGDTIAATLLASGIRVFRETAKLKEHRGLFCGIGQCTDCVMEVNGKPNIRTCVTLSEPGMHVNTQKGLGEWRSEV